MDDIWLKSQAYSLTFWPKYHVFGHFISCVRKWRKAKKVENERFLAKNGKPIALLFGQNMVFLGTF